jgi:tetratricopeptide (TPR) repeat protein
MRISTRATWLLAVSLLAVVAASVGQIPEAQAARRESAPKINPKILKPLQAANELAKAEQYAEAEIELQKTDAVSEKTPMEQFQIDELGGFILLKQQKYDGAATALERGLESGLLPPELVSDRLRLLSQLFLQTEPRDLNKSGEYGKRWLEATGTRDPVMLGLVGQAAYFSDNISEAANYMNEAVASVKAAGEKPDENWLLVLQSSYSRLKNNPGTLEATKDLVRYYPKKEHWVTLTQALLSQAASKDRQILQVFRLMYQVDAMDEAEDFTESATVAIQRGSPGEALKFMEKGYATGILETSGDKARSEALRAEAQRLTESDEKTLGQFEKEARAAKTGEADVRLGEAFLSYDQAAKGLEAIQRGIDKGGVKDIDEANLSLGRAYILTGNGADAVKSFEKVKSPEFAQLAQLWSIYAGQL